jgi:hypothetical protein
MPITPSKHDADAGFTETLTAAAVRRFPDVVGGEPPWIDMGNAGIAWPGELDRWLRELPGWEDNDIDYQVYVVPEEAYQPLYQMKVEGLAELGSFDFLATMEDVASVRAASSGRDVPDPGPVGGGQQ